MSLFKAKVERSLLTFALSNLRQFFCITREHYELLSVFSWIGLIRLHCLDSLFTLSHWLFCMMSFLDWDSSPLDLLGISVTVRRCTAETLSSPTANSNLQQTLEAIWCPFGMTPSSCQANRRLSPCQLTRLPFRTDDAYCPQCLQKEEYHCITQKQNILFLYLVSSFNKSSNGRSRLVQP